MHQFHEYIAGQIVEMLQNRRVVVFYDHRREFQPFVDELLADSNDSNPIVRVTMREIAVSLARFSGSFVRLRAEVEPLVAIDHPEPLLVYLAGVKRDLEGSLLMELECAGESYEPQLKRLAPNVLRHKYSYGQMDQMLGRDGLTYSDIVRFLEQTEDGEQASILKNIFSRESWADMLVEWLADDSKDKPINEKEAVTELLTMIRTRLGLELNEDDLAKARARTARYALINEFRGALAGNVPASLGMIPAPPSSTQSKRVCDLVEALRKQKPEAYVALADQVEKDLGLSAAGFQAGDLGAVETFRFEERVLLARVALLIAERKYDEAMTVIERRAHSFWLNQQIKRRAQWECCRLMAELGLAVAAIRPALSNIGKNPAQWVDSYTAQDGWYKADQTHRQLEAWVAKMDDEPEAEKGLGVVRREYEETLKKMAVGFAQAFESAGWNVPGALHQTEVYSKVVAPGKALTAYFLVDAMRYEMGADLVSQLPEVKDLSIRPAIAALPTITEVGMAALLPGASASFSVIERKNELAAKIEESVLSDSTDRMKLLKARVPGAVEMTLDKLLSTPSNKLQKDIEGAPLIVIRSQEIDGLGESGKDFLARQTMDSVIGNLARAVRKLAKIGVEAFVIVADHGYQYSMSKDEDMRADSPGGKEADLHRRCWAGQGGQTPAGSVRIPGAELGYETDLDFIFPKGLEVYRAQGGLSFHHGGFSLQELLIPVISFRAMSNDNRAAGVKVKLEGLPAAVTNRIFSVRVTMGGNLFSADLAPVRIVLIAGGEQAGQAEMAVNAEFDRQTGCVKLKPGVEANVGIMLTLEECPPVRVVVLDPATDAVLYESAEMPVKVM